MLAVPFITVPSPARHPVPCVCDRPVLVERASGRAAVLWFSSLTSLGDCNAWPFTFLLLFRCQACIVWCSPVPSMATQHSAAGLGSRCPASGYPDHGLSRGKPMTSDMGRGMNKETRKCIRVHTYICTYQPEAACRLCWRHLFGPTYYFVGTCLKLGALARRRQGSV